jgi:phosphatidylserine/phosphatidylglycerophosphate/cardiolipin synthase-like enzyme
MAKSRKKSSKQSPIVTVIAAIMAVIAAVVGILTGNPPGGGGSAPTDRPAITQPANVQPTRIGSVATNPPASSGSVSSPTNWLQLYFINPTTAKANSFETVLVNAINQATTSIDIASFDFNLKNVVDALAAAQKRGVKVRLVIDAEEGNMDIEQTSTTSGYKALFELGRVNVPYVDGGRSNGLMHNKIYIFDAKVLYIGSWNAAFNDTTRNDNNMLRITNTSIISNFLAKFNEMYENKRFGARAQVGAIRPKLTAEGTPVEIYFSPVDDVMSRLIAEVNGAKKSVRFMIFTFTYDALADAMIAQMKKGLKVEGVIESRGASNGELPRLFCAKVPVRSDGNSGTLHHKVIIIDDETVITGSFNFTEGANIRNDDYSIIIRNKNVAQAFIAEYNRVYGLGRTPADITCR